MVANVRNPIKPGNHASAKGRYWEDWVMDKLIRLGHEVQGQPYNSPFDLLLDGNVRIDVKSGSHHDPKVGIKSTQYQFGVNKNSRNKTDFYILVIPETKECFVIPSADVSPNRYQIFFCWPTLRPELHKWAAYYERWELLDPAHYDGVQK